MMLETSHIRICRKSISGRLEQQQQRLRLKLARHVNYEIWPGNKEKYVGDVIRKGVRDQIVQASW